MFRLGQVAGASCEQPAGWGQAGRPPLLGTCPRKPSDGRGWALASLAGPVLGALSARDAAALAFSALGSFAWVKIFDLLAANNVLEQKLSRKIVHITTGPLFILTWPLFSGAAYARYLALLVPAANFLRLFLVGTGVVKDEGLVKSISRQCDRTELLRGPLYYVMTLMAVTALCWRDSMAGMMVVAVMCAGDGFADVIGRQWGRKRWSYNRSKTLEGSAAMFVAGTLTGIGLMVVFRGMGYISFCAGPTFLGVVLISCISTFVEALPINNVVDDNLSVPLVAGLLANWLLM
ncbi:unnamed protein product [Ostreobium quekettii]|uniref:phytol kinase n=1 Tax=Ostreobium quekettii TaxID=121088 RepID=A0A8S1J512_9CHLO|nr:unnamed protein product [Ostreobium quekettii]|eukprot:evm.model.scf_343.10 EVM.evm.TU.scf_343.10   scf_343:81592-83700(+)